MPTPGRLSRTLVLLIAVAALSPASPAPAAEGSPAPLPHASPREAGMDAEVLADIPRRMREFVERHQISGAVTLVVRQGKIVHHEAVGQADLEEQMPMRKDTLFAVASMTKPIAATALMILQDEGKLSVDDPVSKYIPEFASLKLKDGSPAQREMTLRHALTHTAGLGGEQKTESSLQETMELLARRPLDFEPGEKWQYSPGLNVCGRVVEIVSEQPFEKFLSERILEPLEMTDTTFRPTPAQQKRLAQLYQPDKEKQKLEPAEHWLTDFDSGRAPNPSGGLFSTATDMARFYQMILNGGELNGRRIVSPEAVDEMTTIQTGDLSTGFTPGNGWGLGWCVVREPQGVTQMLSPGSFGHGGAFGTQGWVDPQREMIFVLLIQRTNFGNSDDSDIRETFQELSVRAVSE